MKRATFLRGVGAMALAAPAAPAIVRAQGGYPDKQIRMVIPFAPGGTTDLLARAVGQHFSQAWGQPVVADNRAGANGVVAGEIVAKAPGDGYTLSMVAMGHAINPLIYKKLPYDGERGLHAHQPDGDLPAARAGEARAQGQHARPSFWRWRKARRRR